MNWREDRVLIAGGLMTIFFACITLYVAIKLPDDGQTFSTFATALAVFYGALVGWLRPPEKLPPPGSTTTSSTTQEQVIKTPPDAPPTLERQTP